VNTSSFRAPLLALGFCALAFGQASAPPVKVGIIHIQNAIIQTKDGQKAAADLNEKFGPRRKQVEAKQNELQQMEQQFRTGANTMSDEAKVKLQRDIEQRRKQLQREMDDANAEVEQEQGRLLQDLGQKLMAVLDRYATEKGFALILDVSSPQTPVLYASNTIDITNDIVALYDKGAGQTGAAPAAGAPTGAAAPTGGTAPGGAIAPRPAAPKPAAPKPAATPK
jgi:outer membrane protein